MNEERRKKLLRRVGKLLAQADGTPYKHEAESALLMAQRVLCENGMTIAEVDALSAEEQKTLVANEEVVSMGHRHSEWLLSLARVLAKQFRCKHYIHHRWTQPPVHAIRLVGLQEDVAVARDVYAYARQTAERLAKAYAAEPGVIEKHLYQKDGWRFYSEWSRAERAAANRQVQRLWLEGFVEGVQAKFREQVKQSASLAVMLVLHPVVLQAVDNLHLGTSSYRPRNGDVRNDEARRAGIAAGRAFEPQRPQRLTTPTPRLGSGS